jgi:hypothetical protein
MITFTPPAQAADLNLGAATTGTLTTPNETDWFKVTLDALGSYTFSLHGANTMGGTLTWPGRYADVHLSLLDAVTGQVVYSTVSMDGLGDPALAVDIDHSGEYYVAVAGGPETGSYTLWSAKTDQDDYFSDREHAQPEGLDVTVTGTLSHPSDGDSFTLPVTQGTIYTLDFQGATDLKGDVGLRVDDADFQNLVHQDLDGVSSSIITFVPRSSGDALVSVTSDSDGSGANFGHGGYHWSVHAVADDYAAGPATAGVLAPGQPVSARFDAAGDSDWFGIDVEAGTTYLFKTSAGYLRMAAADGQALDSADAGMVERSGALAWTPRAAGHYYVAAAGTEAGAYTLSMEVPAPDDYGSTPASAVLVAAGTIRDASLELPGDSDCFAFHLLPGYGYTIHVLPGEGLNANAPTRMAPLMVNFIDANGQPVTVPKTDSLAHGWDYVLQPSANQEVYAVVSQFYGLGKYSVTLDAPVPDAIPADRTSAAAVLPGASLQSAIDFAGDKDSVRVDLKAGGLYEFLLQGASSQQGTLRAPYLFLRDVDGTFLDASFLRDGHEAAIVYQAKADQSVWLEASDAKATAGSYVMRVAAATVGTAADDVFHAGGGNAVFDGGTGLDTLVLQGTRTDYDVISTSDAVEVTHRAGAQAQDKLLHVERIVFDDTALAFDTDGNAGQVYRLYQAAFAREPDAAGLGYWLAQNDHGASLASIAQDFVHSREFASLYGDAPSNTQLATAFYQNVMHRAPDAAGLQYWVDLLAHGTTAAEVLASFSESAENQANVVGQIAHGITYLPYAG